MLHESGATAGSTYGIPHSGNIYKRIYPDVDVCINRENPHRKLPDSTALVVGYDAAGRFQNTIPAGVTHGYWTMQAGNGGVPEDHGGSGGNYLARILFRFDLDKTGIVASDKVIDAQFKFRWYKSNTIRGSGEYLFDFHRIHPGLTSSRGSTNPTLITENATWYEYDHSGTGRSGPGQGEGGPTGSRGFGLTDGFTHGSSRWEAQGLGFTGGTAEHTLDNAGATQWTDYSGGVTGANQIVTPLTDNLYTIGFTAARNGEYAVRAGDEVKLDFTKAVEDAVQYYGNKLQFMIKLRDDHTYVDGQSRVYVAIVSSEADPDKDPEAGEEPQYAPSLHVTYSR